MATISRWARERGLNVVHVSSDKDMLQLVDHGVHVLKPRTRELFSVDDVINAFGVHPKLMCEYQALAGDSVDNIPGVKGVGPKTAAALVNYFQSVENMYRQLGLHPVTTVETSTDIKPAEILVKALVGVKSSPANILKKLQTTSYEDVKLYRELCMLDGNIDIAPMTIDDAPIEAIAADQMDSELLQRKERYLSIISSIVSGDDDGHGLDMLLKFALDDKEKYSAHRSSASTDIEQKFSSTSLRYVGERAHCYELMKLFGDEFVSSLNNLRTHYHKLDRQV
jgi:5'-3' exonuclease